MHRRNGNALITPDREPTQRDTQGVGDRDIHEHAERYLSRCRETARLAAKHYGWTLISCIKDGQLRSIEDIHEEIYRHIAACLED